MLPEFNEEQLNNQLRKLTAKQRFAFALSCCERLYPNYHIFTKEHNWGNSLFLREALDYCWKYLENDDIKGETDALIKKCDSVTPDTEDFCGVYVSPALDAAVCTTNTLKLMTSDSIDKVVEIASLCIDTVDMYVQEIEDLNSGDPELEKKILQHKLMQSELGRQKEDLALVTQYNSVNYLPILIKKWKGQKSNIGL